jgi:methionyl aminopeptidase
VTVDLSGNEGLVKASEDALYAAIDIIKDGVNTADIGEVIEETIKSHDFRSITNLTGHGLSQYNSHAEPSIPNRKEKKGVILEEGDVIALEPFATDGVGKIFEKGSHAEIYQHVNVKPIRSRDARMLLKEIEVYKTLPFAVRWLSTNRASFALKQMERAGLVKAFPILKEKDGVLISQAEHTVIVQKDGYEITT